jgi:hypothetical protein
VEEPLIFLVLFKGSFKDPKYCSLESSSERGASRIISDDGKGDNEVDVRCL